MTKRISKILTTSLESLYCQESSTNSDNSSIATIDIVVRGAISTAIMNAIEKHFEKCTMTSLTKHITYSNHTLGFLDNKTQYENDW